ncbi:MAG: hypothetical protein KME45_00195 [Stenomitos rutilans HA7619-LM2]|nr:hypothetical protein [Stenomitos rutilans HA7619-LM2]
MPEIMPFSPLNDRQVQSVLDRLHVKSIASLAHCCTIDPSTNQEPFL